MTDSTETTIYEVAPSTGTGYGVYTATIAAQNDTVTLGNFTSILDAIVIKVSDNSTCTYTKATNVITITQSLTNTKVFIMVVGT